MIKTCEDCQKVYDDAQCWTICPHNSLAVGATTSYCGRHDFYDCKLCEAEQQAAARKKAGDTVVTRYKDREPVEWLIVHALDMPGCYLAIGKMQLDWLNDGMSVAPRLIRIDESCNAVRGEMAIDTTDHRAGGGPALETLRGSNEKSR